MKGNTICYVVFSYLFVSVLLSCKKEGSCKDCQQSNKQPIAIAGRDTALVLPNDSVMLDGSSSYDPDGTIREYRWSKIPPAVTYTISNAQTARPLIKNLTTGVYQIELTVIDNKGSSARDTVMIIVDAIQTNHSPIAHAGSDQVVVLPANAAILDGSNSTDIDNNITNYAWSKISGPSSFSFSNANAVQTQVTTLLAGVYQFELKVTDAGGLFSSDTIMVAVTADNHPPVANAGQDIALVLPVNIALLNGNGSTDTDNNIAGYLWRKVSGPSSFTITDANAVQTQVTSLVGGLYEFELKVTDAGGLFSMDTVKITVNPAINLTCGSNRPSVTVSQTAFGTLSKPRAHIAVASAGNKILFAGGVTDATYPAEMSGSSRVDIYDISTNTWSTAELSVARYGIAAVAAGNKIFFAGGTSGELGDVLETYHTTVDIYDVVTGVWTVASLSEHVSNPAVVALGNKVFFVGGYGTTTIGNITYYGYYSNKIDIYDLSTNTWSAVNLSEPKTDISAVAANNKVYLAGGHHWNNGPQYSNNIDIYDGQTNSWSTSTLSEQKAIGQGGIAFGNKIYWAGGGTSAGAICNVEIKDLNTQTTSFEYLLYPSLVIALIKNDQILFHRHSEAQLDIYNPATNNWSIGSIPQNRPFASFISVSNTIYMAGGFTSGTSTVCSAQVWKLEF